MTREVGEAGAAAVGLSCRALIVFAVLITTACAGRIRPGGPPTGRPPDDDQAATFTATAYCTGSVTATGSRPNEQTIAADPDVLPMGTRIRLTGLPRRYNRTYVVGDTGGNIQGRRLDLYMRDCREAIAFGRQSVRVAVLR